MYGEIPRLQEIPVANITQPPGNNVNKRLKNGYVMGRPIISILFVSNNIPVIWPCMKQTTMEVAAYNSRIFATQTCDQQIIELHYSPRTLNVRSQSNVIESNQSVNNNMTQVQAIGR